MTDYWTDSNHPPATRRSRLAVAGVAAAIFFAFVLVAAARAFQGGIVPVFGPSEDTSIAAAAPLAAPLAAPSPETLSQSFSAVAKAIGPSVVHINVVTKSVTPQARSFGFGFGFPDPTPRPQRGSGSGVIVNPNGFIVTNNHVVGEATQINVRLSDGRELRAKLVGTDPQTDLAVIKIDGNNFPAASFGNSEALQQGEWVIAVGSPFGLEQTITAGIISATGRRVTASPYDAFIQTDASINPGNSGGPLVNLQGQVIGINTLIFSQTGANMGIGFAIPSNMVRHIYDQLATKGKVTRGYLGVNVRDLEPAIAESLGLSATQKGALVSDVAGENSPAAKAGLRSGDVVVSINGKEISSSQDLTSYVADLAPGSSAQIRILRDGGEQSLTATLAERPARLGLPGGGDDEEAGPAGGGDESAGRQKLGVVVQELTPELAQQLRVRSKAGAVIRSVAPDGAAADARLRPGDVILRVGRTVINSPADLTAALSSVQAGQTVAIQFERAGEIYFVTVTLD